MQSCPSPLLSDLYQLTMALGYWRTQKFEQPAIFHLHFRASPFGGGYTIAAGLQSVVEFIQNYRWAASDLAYLGSLEGAPGSPLFPPDFLRMLSALRLCVSLEAIEEGRAVFPLEPIIRVHGPIGHCQLLESALLNFVNFQSLIATKAARIRSAAGEDTVLEFGLRRAQGVDGALHASRAAYLGGAHATSNLMAGQAYGIPVQGTHAHSWVMSFESELEAFEAYARCLPDNVVLLVDTYDVRQGVLNAIEVGHQLKARGMNLRGIRIDSGDLAFLSVMARSLLDDAGFNQTRIVGSNDLDESVIESLKIQGARIDTWGVGTHLVTGHPQAALGGVYKLAALHVDGHWVPKIKISESLAKISIPGAQQIRRYRQDAYYICDLIYSDPSFQTSASLNSQPGPYLVDPMDPWRRRRLPLEGPYEDLLVPILRAGELVYQVPPLDESRRRCLEELTCLHPGIRRFKNPHIYPVGLDPQLFEKRQRMILARRGFAPHLSAEASFTTS